MPLRYARMCFLFLEERVLFSVDKRSYLDCKNEILTGILTPRGSEGANYSGGELSIVRFNLRGERG